MITFKSNILKIWLYYLNKIFRRYMSPEVLEGATEFSGFAFQQIDVYAASLVIWEVLSRTRVPECPEGNLLFFKE
jgi:hypothetical protein